MDGKRGDPAQLRQRDDVGRLPRLFLVERFQRLHLRRGGGFRCPLSDSYHRIFTKQLRDDQEMCLQICQSGFQNNWRCEDYSCFKCAQRDCDGYQEARRSRGDERMERRGVFRSQRLSVRDCLLRGASFLRGNREEAADDLGQQDERLEQFLGRHEGRRGDQLHAGERYRQ